MRLENEAGESASARMCVVGIVHIKCQAPRYTSPFAAFTDKARAGFPG